MAHRLSGILACGSFPDQGSNTRLLRWQADSLSLSHQGSPAILFMVTLFRESVVCFAGTVALYIREVE